MASRQAVSHDPGIAEWMEQQRRRLVLLGHDAETAAREAWDGATRTGQDIVARTPGEVRALGARLVEEREAGLQAVADNIAKSRAASAARERARLVAGRPSARSAAGGSRMNATTGSPIPPLPQDDSAGYSYGRLYSPPAHDMPELRRQQAEFKRTQLVPIDRENRWMAVPALAPAVAALGLAGAGAIAARMAAPALKRPALQFLEREAFRLPKGDNWSTRVGRLADRALAAKLKQKDGWDPQPRVKGESGENLRPDAGPPKRNPAKPEERFYLEQKPNTPSGRRAGERQARRYRDATKQRTRVIYYNPDDFL